MKLGIFYSHPRTEEKALFASAEADSDVELVKIKDDDDMLNFNIPDGPKLATGCDVTILRSISNTKNFYYANIIKAIGSTNSKESKKNKNIAVNDSRTISICGDKFLTSLKLAENSVATPKTMVCFDEKQALVVANELSDNWKKPIVMKPVVGSWGRLLSKISDRDAAETILEHKTVLGGINHSNIFYIQEYIDKKDKQDIRAVVIGGEVTAAMYRTSEHWITNTARGAKTKPYEITPEFKKLVLKAVKAVTEGKPALLGVDLIETTTGLKVVEVNSGVEWHGLIETTEVDIPKKIIEFCKSLAD